MITFNSIYPTKNQSNVGVNEDIVMNVSADFELDPRDVVFKIHGVEIVPEVYSVYYGNSTSELDITLYTKRRVKYATERRYGQDDFRYGMRDVYPSMLNYGSRYVVEIIVFGMNNNNEYEEQKEIFAFTTEEGVFKNPNPREYYYSDMTQAVANYFPEWSKTRFDKYSNIQQLVNPMGEQLDKMAHYLEKQKANTFIQTCNLNELSTMTKVELGRDYPITEIVSQSGDPYYVQPEIRAIQDITEFDLFADSENSFQTFFYNKLPTRIDSEREKLSSTVVFEDLEIGSIRVPVNYELENPRELYLVLSEGGSSIIRERSKVRLLQVRVRGVDRYDDLVYEDLLSTVGRPIMTKKDWKRIDTVELLNARGEKVSGSLYIVPPVQSIVKDFKRRISVDDIQDTIFWSMEDRNGCTILSKRVELGKDILETLREAGQTKIVQEFQLVDIDNNTKLQLVDFTIDPFSEYIYAIDNEYLYIFDKREEYSELAKKLSGDNGSADFLLEIEDDELGLDENGEKEVLIKCIHSKPGGSIVKYRIIITKPDGSIVYIDKNNNLTTDRNEATIITDQADIMLDTRQYSVVLDQCGEYIFELETLFRGGRTTSHKQIYKIHKKSALIKYKLERILDTASPLSLHYYKDQQIKVFDSDNVLNSLVLRKDGVMIDYNDKILYFIEDYDSVEVTS